MTIRLHPSQQLTEQMQVSNGRILHFVCLSDLTRPRATHQRNGDNQSTRPIVNTPIWQLLT